MIIDCHCHAGKGDGLTGPWDTAAPLDGYLRWAAPYGIDPATGVAFSDKSKLVAGLLQILLPLGIGRMYMGHTGLGVVQLLVTLFTCGIGSVWPFIDGIVILAGSPRDGHGRPMKMT